MLPLLTGEPLMDITGQIQKLVEVTKISSAVYASNGSKSVSWHLIPSVFANSIVVWRLIPGSTYCSLGVKRSLPLTTKMLAPFPSQRFPLVSSRMAQEPGEMELTSISARTKFT